jgi:hypothetical protein
MNDGAAGSGALREPVAMLYSAARSLTMTQ